MILYKFVEYIAHLEYRELVDSEGAIKILPSNYIPVHPHIYFSDFAYTGEFLTEVRKSLPDSLKNDVAAIEEILKTDLGITITDEIITDKYDQLKFVDVASYVGFSGNSIEVEFVSSNIALDKRKGQEKKLSVYSPHPMPIDRLKEYAISPDNTDLDIRTWYTHNYSDNGLPLELYFRNFAIMFNNLGLKKLKSL